MIGRNDLPYFGFYFHFLIVSFNLDSHIQLTFFVVVFACTFGVISKKPLPHERSQIFLPFFFFC